MTKTLTSTNDLENMMNDYIKETKSDINFQVSFVKIDFPISNKINYYIVNLYAYEEIPKEIGHWITIITKDKNCIVYTCFGLYSLGLLKFFGENGYKNVVFDLSTDQPLNSKSCGYFCLRYIIDKQWKLMDNYLWFEIDNKNSHPSIEGCENKFNLISKNIDEKNKPKLRKNNDIYQRTLN